MRRVPRLGRGFAPARAPLCVLPVCLLPVALLPLALLLVTACADGPTEEAPCGGCPTGTECRDGLCVQAFAPDGRDGSTTRPPGGDAGGVPTASDAETDSDAGEGPAVEDAAGQPEDSGRGDTAVFDATADEADMAVPGDSGAGDADDAGPDTDGAAPRDVDAGRRDAETDVDTGRRDAETDIDAAPAPDAALADGAQPAPDAEAPAPDAAPPAPDAAAPRLPYGAACESDDACEGGRCRRDARTGASTCSQACARSTDCPGTDACMPDGEGRICGRTDVGAPCDVPGVCLEGICIEPPSPAAWHQPQPHCSVYCGGDAKCPAGYVCRPVALPNGVEQVCVTAVTEIVECSPRTFFPNCQPVCPVRGGRAFPDTAFCVTPADENTGYCSCSCDTVADCPAGFACRPVPVGARPDPLRRGLCEPMAGYRCPDAPDEAECLSSWCVSDGPLPTDVRCTTDCERDADCPAGHTCQPLGADLFCWPADPG